MAPKRRGPKKRSKKVRTPIEIDGLTKMELSKEQMEEYLVRLQVELDREREERNYFQLQRNKIHTFCEITDNELEEVRAEKKNIDKDIEEDEMRHQLEIKVYKQKLKHILYEHQNTIAELKAAGLVSAKVVQEEKNKLETGLHKDVREVMVEMQEEFDYENTVKELEQKRNEEITKTRDIREEQIAEIQVKCEKKIELLIQELENKRKKVINEVEDQWTNHLNTLIEDHNQAFVEVDALMIGIHKDMYKNHSLRAQLEKVDMDREMKEKNLVDLLQENEHLTQHLSKVKDEINEIERKMKYFILEEDDSEKVKQKKLDEQRCKNETLEQKFRKLQMKRDDLEKATVQNIQQVQAKADRKSLLLDRKLAGLIDGIEKTQAQLLLVLSASNIDQTALDEIETYMDSSHHSTKNLECERAKISQARKDLLYFYEAKQRSLGVPVEEL